jgi:hypothetical protein
MHLQRFLNSSGTKWRLEEDKLQSYRGSWRQTFSSGELYVSCSKKALRMFLWHRRRATGSPPTRPLLSRLFGDSHENTIPTKVGIQGRKARGLDSVSSTEWSEKYFQPSW